MNVKKIQNTKFLLILIVLIISIIFIPLIFMALFKYRDNYTVERIYYKGHDNIIISGLIYRPDTKSFPGKRPGIICLHDFMGSKENVHRFSEDLVRAGFVVLAYDQRGFGNSEGVSHFGNPNYEIKDLEISVNYIKALDYVNDSEIGLTGIGYGGALTIMGAGIFGDEINAFFAMSSYSNLTETFLHLNFNSIQSNVMKIISKYIGYIPNPGCDNELTEEQSINLKGLIELICNVPSMAEFKNILLLKDNYLSFNHSALKLLSPINSNYSSNIKNNSLFLAVGDHDQIYPNNFSKSVKDFLLENYNIHCDYQVFSNSGHKLENYKLDCVLVNYFIFQLKKINPPSNDLEEYPYIHEINDVLIFNDLPKANFEEENIFLAIFNVIGLIPLGILIPYIIILALIYIFCAILYHLRENNNFKKNKKKTIKKEDSKTPEKKDIIRRIEKTSMRKKLAQVEKKESLKSLLGNKTLGVIVLILTVFNLIIIPAIGMSYLNLYTFFLWIYLLMINIVLSIFFYMKIESWEWNEKNEKNEKTIKNNQRFRKFYDILKKNPFYQVLFYLFITFLVILLISFLILIFQFNIIKMGVNSILFTLIMAGTIITLIGLVLIWFDKKYINSSNTLQNYGLSKKNLLKGLCFGIYIVQIPLIILVIISYILILPQPYLSNSYILIFIGIPFIFLFFFGFELIFRVLIQNKIKGNKIGEFLIGSLFYAQFIGIFGYIIFMNSYSSNLIYNGVPLSYSGLFGIIFILFSCIGTLNYMITRTPVASSISNTLILFFILALIL